MNLINYLKDKIIVIFISIFSLLLIISLLSLFNIHLLLYISIIFIYTSNLLTIFAIEYLRKKHFYQNITKNLKNLDQKYLITELIKTPEFLEGIILEDILYDINKSYIENINKYKFSSISFEEYIELWCHEIKTPLATSKLMIENKKNDSSLKDELDKIEWFVDQVLFYARSGNPEKDYIISETDLNKIISNVIKKNKNIILSKNIKINSFNEKIIVKSDSKWLEFIINQIISNSIKYSKDKNALISITYTKNKNNVILTIYDNGVGINHSDITRVFDKGFAGLNGRKTYKSTGMGLYLCKKLCDKLSHNISITSIENEYTKVKIVIPSGSLTNDII
ncbi:MAG: sensor histidine kinase [Bacilli bacterium]|nr:sensor histidine kinase [Bacilli bacterium]